MNSGEFTLHNQASQRSTGMPGNPGYMFSGSEEVGRESAGVDNAAFLADGGGASAARAGNFQQPSADSRLDLSPYDVEVCPEGPMSLLHAFCKAVAHYDRDVKLADVCDALRTELSYNYPNYAGHLGGLGKAAAWEKLSKYLDEGKPDCDVSLIAPYALANAFNVDVRLFSVDPEQPLAPAATSGRRATSNHHIRGRERPGARNREVYLARSDDEHYCHLVRKVGEAVLPNGHLVSGHLEDKKQPDGQENVEDDSAFVETPKEGAQEFRDGPEVEKPKWDVFRMSDDDHYHASADEFWSKFRKVFRVLTLVATFLLVLASAVGSKLMLLVMATNLASMSEGGVEPACNCTCQDVSEEDDNSCSLSIVNKTLSATNLYADKVTMRWAWALVFTIITPYIFTFLKSLWHIVGCMSPRWYGCQFLAGVLALELLHTTGVVLLTTHVLPNHDLLQGVAVLLGVGAIPAALKVFSHSDLHERLPWPKMGLDVFVFLLQLSHPVTFIVSKAFSWPSTSSYSLEWKHAVFYISVILISARWWPNYINRFSACCGALKNFANGVNTNPFNQQSDSDQKSVSYKKKVARTNHLLHLIVSVWKSMLTIVGVIGSVVLQTSRQDPSGNVTYQDFFFSVDSLSSSCYVRDCEDGAEKELGLPSDYSPFVAFAVQAGCCIVCYFVGLHACKVQLQKSGFAIPLTLTTPLSVLVICLFANIPGAQTVVQELEGSGIMLKFDAARDSGTIAFVMVAITLWWLSQTRLASHVWFPRVSRISASERLFLLPLFDSEVMEQSMLYNRRNDLDMEKTSAELRIERERRASRFSTRVSMAAGELERLEDPDARDPNVDFIYLCATMWHESDDEMKQILKSIYRLDRDQNWRKNAQEFFSVSDPDYYEFEAHIFFDDAFTEHYENGTKYSANAYVKKLVEVVPLAARSVHKRNIKIRDPVKIPTPYGGRLEWTLPGGNRLIAHLKDKMKIRHKKRWSQVMYMYYFLGYQIIASDYTDAQKEIMAQKTYLMALDGDVDFQPEAVQLLVDMMKRNEDVGAACGRIHPVGSGLIVWYQKFEYAVSHWLQKATEHILGCVLCSPGCFSLFRGSALMDDNVMRRYATPSTEASHYLQYDQGEDRWLCTLLLQQGYRVEYNAAADALTNAPEGFNEFYNQRRRWGPSTMANILDLLMDVKHVVKVNRYMSLLYIAYQAMMFFASLLGPGTIFLMITGALSLVLQGGNEDLPFILNAVPIVFYVVISYFTSDSFQLKVASLLSALYALVMGLVMVSVAIEINKNLCSSSAIFFFVVAGTFLLAALLHPQEFKDVVFGLVYYLLIPCMYLFLIIYSMVNLNNVSWGTREVKPADNAPVPEVKVQQQPPESLQGMLMSFIKRSGSKTENDDGATYSCGSACKIVCCPRPNKTEESKWLLLSNQLQKMTDRMKSMAADMKLVRRRVHAGRRLDDEDDSGSDAEAAMDRPAEGTEKLPLLPQQTAASAEVQGRDEEPPTANEQPTIELRDDLSNPHWIEEPAMMSGPIVLLDDEETNFWKQLIATYLKPLDNNPQQQKVIKEQLLELRNKVTFGFFLANAMFVVVIFTLQRQKSEISVEWPCHGREENQKERVDPIGLCFLAFFILVMILQVIGMLFHRLGTFFHIIATTTLTLCRRISEDKKLEEETEHNARAILAMAQSMSVAGKKMSDGAMSEVEFGGLVERKQTRLVHNILKTISEPAIVSLDEEFKKNVEHIELDLETERMNEQHKFLHSLPPNQKRATINFLRDQRTITSIRRRLSQSSRVDFGRAGRTSVSSYGGRMRRSNTAGSRPRTASNASGASAASDGSTKLTSQRHRASVAFEDENSNVSRCHTIPNTRGQGVAGDEGAAAADALQGNDLPISWRENLLSMRNMSVVMEADEDEKDPSEDKVTPI